MSSSSQPVEPGAQQGPNPSHTAGSSGSGGQPTGTRYKEFGQGYQFAERMANPPPEFFVTNSTPAEGAATASTGTAAAAAGPAPADANAVGAADPGGDGAGGSDIQLQRISGSKEDLPNQAAAWTPPPRPPWYKRISKFWWTVISVVLGILGVVLAILGAMGSFTGHGSSDDTNSPMSSTTSTTSSSTSSSSSSTTSSARPTSTNLPKQCADESTYVKNTVWAGLSVGYTPAFDHVSAAADCCQICFNSPGCAGWLYNGTTPYTPCTKIMINADGNPNPSRPADDDCPAGHVDVTHFSRGDGDCVGGLGPCSDKAATS
ncbi:hypothetical protein QBC47DRAFT_410995 [Echria macrotheca]|uniref:Uncharacterized protein n=1 Tax=Echria macrotheca TaxID=438768 RepID=A0AAJ0BLW8_9PEZI|nr:hypothetical protein QBC47DRAFT_410995 [Echria macrotheca]